MYVGVYLLLLYMLCGLYLPTYVGTDGSAHRVCLRQLGSFGVGTFLIVLRLGLFL